MLRLTVLALLFSVAQAGIITYVWSTSDWSVGSTTCGASVQNRQVTCTIKDTPTIVSDSNCVPSARPKGFRTIQLSPCPVWVAGPWSEPTVTCGKAVVTRYLTCYVGQTIVKPAKCDGVEEPKKSKVVTLQKCPVYKWLNSEWSTPSVTCGPTVVYRDVTCVEIGVGVVDESYCYATKKPSDSKSIALEDCPTYSWYAADWSSPAATCGSTVQSRTVYCTQDYTNNDPVEDYLCDDALRPATYQAVELEACIYYEWYAGVWSEPSVTCGSGIKTRAVTCVIIGDTEYVAQADELCTDEKPVTYEAVELEVCPVYEWANGEWGLPSVTCGDSPVYREVYCQQVVPEPVETVEDTYCDAETKPVTFQVVAQAACPVYRWSNSQWSTPSVTCGDATVTRTVTCIDQNDNTVVSDALCTYKVKPATSKILSQTACPTYSWKTGSWSTPSATCGRLVYTRTVQCAQDQNGAIVADSYCTATKPNTEKTVKITCTL